MKRIALLLSLGAACAAPSFALADVPGADMVRCAAVVSDSERLACYDGLADRLGEAAAVAKARKQAAAEAAAKAAAGAALAAEQAAAAAEARKVERFGAESTGNREALDDGKLNELSAKAVEIFTDKYGMYRLMLDNGQLWKQVDGKLLTVRRGDEITVKRAALGSYRLKVERQGRSVTAKRLK